MDENEDELSGAPILLTDKKGPADEQQQSSKKISWKECCQVVVSCCSRLCRRKDKISRNMRLLLALVLGQFLSLLLCGTGVTSALLVTRHGIATPTTQTFLTYVFMGMVYGVILAVRSDFLGILKRNWWKYIILGVVDMEANYLVVLAYKYTSLTTVQLLDSFTVATVMILSFIFLRARYKIINFMGVALSMVGILSLVLADVQGSRAGRGPNPLLGDLLCLAGSLLYAISNVAQEFLVKNHGVVEYLGLIGVTGSIASATQLLVLERETLVRVDWTYEIVLLYLGFGLFQFLFYSTVPLLLRLTSAVVFNLSILTADIYTLLFGLYLFHYKFSFFYVLSFILILTGVFIYNLRQPSTAKKSAKEKKSKGQELHRRRQRRRREEEEGGEGGVIREEGQGGGQDEENGSGRGSTVLSGLRRALFESQTYEMSASKEAPPANTTTTDDTANTSPSSPIRSSNSFVSKLASKLISKLPTLSSAADHSAMESGSKRHMRGYKDLTVEEEEEEGDQGFFQGSRAGLIHKDRSSSGSEAPQYGSVERPGPEGASSSLPGPNQVKRRTSRASSSPPAQGAQ